MLSTIRPFGLVRSVILALLAVGLFQGTVVAADRAAVPVTLEKVGEAWQLIREGKPWVVKGAGGDASKSLLAACGGNTCRTWGAGREIGPMLDECQRLGIAVVVGYWVPHERHGFDWTNQALVDDQVAQAEAAVRRWKDHPALLAWAFGNEMEGYAAGDNERMWKAVERMAKKSKEIDPNHPTMTVTAEIGGKRVEMLHQHCPSIDIMGINSYGGCASIPERYRKAGGTKPYLVTEYGTAGIWELGKNDIGAVIELTTTQKADSYGLVYDVLAKDRALCLGSIAFTWGSKQEATATWFGMIMPDGSRTAPVDALADRWGKPVPNRCPVIEPLTLAGSNKLDPGATVNVVLKTSDPENDALTVDWVLSDEAEELNTGGDTEAALATHPAAIVKGDLAGVELKMPAYKGTYRLFAVVRDGKGGAAMANLPLRVESGAARPPAPAKKGTLPICIVGETGSPYVPSGWIGDAKAITLDPDCATKPKSGAACTKVSFTQGGGWGGVVWQHPANAWGDRQCGLDLSGAQRLMFWARGDAGGEEITFGTGMVGADKKYHDTFRQSL
ncbi:MAG TPA: glycoside hydrolase family 2 TIM barrel-domain containing protein, partial [Planctomycetota bacterium]|nr:glycoside hydrolase family 2 TIM barrel-domain containing protein [Planctomycetota bacterium]